MRSRAALKLTRDHVRTHIFGCTRDADLAGDGIVRPLEQRPKHNPRGPMAAFVNRRGNIYDTRIWRKILPRLRHAQARDASTRDA